MSKLDKVLDNMWAFVIVIIMAIIALGIIGGFWYFCTAVAHL